MARQRLFGNAARTQATHRDILGDGSGSIRQLGPTAVVHAHDEVEGLAVRGCPVGLLQRVDDALPQLGPAPAPPHVHAPLGELVGAPREYVGGVVHDERDLGGRALPILGGEGVDAQVTHARVDRAGNRIHEGILPRPMPLGAGQAAAVGPASVAVHDEGDVRGHFPLSKDRCLTVPLAWPEQRRGGVVRCAVHGGGSQVRHG